MLWYNLQCVYGNEGTEQQQCGPMLAFISLQWSSMAPRNKTHQALAPQTISVCGISCWVCCNHEINSRQEIKNITKTFLKTGYLNTCMVEVFRHRAREQRAADSDEQTGASGSWNLVASSGLRSPALRRCCYKAVETKLIPLIVSTNMLEFFLRKKRGTSDRTKAGS